MTTDYVEYFPRFVRYRLNNPASARDARRFVGQPDWHVLWDNIYNGDV
jgi:hypothetical protein